MKINPGGSFSNGVVFPTATLEPDWTKIMESWMSPGAPEAQPGNTPADSLDKELGKDKVNDVLGDYLEETETESAVKNLLRAHPELAGNEAPEAMDVDEQPPPESVAKMQGVGDQPMETEQTGVLLGSFQSRVGDAQLQPVPGQKY